MLLRSLVRSSNHLPRLAHALRPHPAVCPSSLPLSQQGLTGTQVRDGRGDRIRVECLPFDGQFEYGAHGDEFVHLGGGVLWSSDGGREGESAVGEGGCEEGSLEGGIDTVCASVLVVVCVRIADRSSDPFDKKRLRRVASPSAKSRRGSRGTTLFVSLRPSYEQPQAQPTNRTSTTP